MNWWEAQALEPSLAKGACPNYFGNYNVIVTLGGEGVKGHDVINYILWAGKTLQVAMLIDSRYSQAEQTTLLGNIKQ